MQGHIRSIIPQKGGIAPVDSNTIALFRYEQDEKDRVKDIKAVGNLNALEFNGTPGNYAAFGNIGTNSLTNCSVDFWHKTSSTSAWMLMKGHNNGHYVMAITTGSFYHGNSGSPTVYVDGEISTTLNRDGQWHHYAVTGLDLSSWAEMNVTNYPNFEMHGNLEGLRIWEESLNEEEIQKLFDGKSVQRRMKAFWKLDEGEGSVLYDCSGNGHDGALTGTEWNEGRSNYALSEQGVLVEEATTNIIDPNGFYSDSNFKVDKLDEYTFKVTLLTDPTALTNAYYIAQMVPTPIAANTPATMSVEVLERSNPAWKIGISGWGPIDSTNGVYTKIGNREIKTITHHTDWSYSVSLGYLNDDSKAALVPGDYIIVRNAQIEQKALATSFVEGQRTISSLAYMPSLLPLDEFTVSMWVQLKETSGDQHNLTLSLENRAGNYIFQMGRHNSEGFFIHWAGGGTLINVPMPKEEWMMLTVTLSPSVGWRLYKDGKFVKSDGRYPALNIDTGSKLYVGRYSNNASNMLVGEMRIEKVARSAEEIQAWYHHGRGMMGQ